MLNKLQFNLRTQYQKNLKVVAQSNTTADTDPSVQVNNYTPQPGNLPDLKQVSNPGGFQQNFSPIPATLPSTSPEIASLQAAQNLGSSSSKKARVTSTYSLMLALGGTSSRNMSS